MYISPMGKLVAGHAKVGDTAEEIAYKTGLTEEQVIRTLEELQTKMLLVIDDDRVASLEWVL